MCAWRDAACSSSGCAWCPDGVPCDACIILARVCVSLVFACLLAACLGRAWLPSSVPSLLCCSHARCCRDAAGGRGALCTACWHAHGACRQGRAGWLAAVEHVRVGGSILAERSVRLRVPPTPRDTAVGSKAVQLHCLPAHYKAASLQRCCADHTCRVHPQSWQAQIIQLGADCGTNQALSWAGSHSDIAHSTHMLCAAGGRWLLTGAAFG